MIKYVLIILFLWFPTHGYSATTIEASSCSKTDVDAAIDLAIAGDTVSVPEGSCNWESRVNVNKAITVQGQTTIARNDTTYVLTPTDRTSITGYAFNIQATSGVRISGFTFSSVSSFPFVFPSGFVSARIDHNHLNFGGKPWDPKGNAINGLLFDHNLIINPGGEQFYINGVGNSSWRDGGSCGADNPGDTVWIEDNEFRWTGGGANNPVDHGEGARAVWRHNKFTANGSGDWGAGFFESHGHCWGQRDGSDNAAAYCVEASNNKFDNVSGDTTRFNFRGGRILFYGNELTGSGWSSSNIVRFWIQEVSTNCNTTPCAVQAHEDMGIHQVPLSGDPNFTGGLCDVYPCPMQPNNSYVWDNTSTGQAFTVAANEPAFMQENRDWWDDFGSGDTNFTTGATIPATCSDDDVFWNTVTGNLSRCDGDNNWTTVYTAYDYPHPLQTEEEPPPPAAPTKVRIIMID